MHRELSIAILSLVIVVAASVASAPDIVGVLGAGLGVLMLTIAVIDWRSFVIPDGLNIAAFLLGLVHAAILMPDSAVWSIAMALLRAGVLALLFLAIRIVYARIRGRQGLGLGDVKLAAVAGAWLDWMLMPVVIELAVLAALCGYVGTQYLLGRSISLTNKVPFGVFLAPAIWLCWILETAWLT